MTTRQLVPAKPDAATLPSFAPVRSALLQRKCACGGAPGPSGECVECEKKKRNPQHKLDDQSASNAGVSASRLPVMQRKLTIGASDDPLELEADRVADQVLAASAHPDVSGAPRNIQRLTGQPTGQVDTAPASVDRVLANAGRPLDSALRQDMEQRFGHDFSRVRVHSGPAAEQSARDVRAHAYTVGHNIVFGSGSLTRETHSRRRLIAHELTHVVQQGSGQTTVIRRGCSDPSFCTPYATTEEAESAEWWIRNTYMAAEGLATYGSEVESLYERFLDRRPGDSLEPVVFDSDSSYVVSSFTDSGDTEDDVDAVINLVGARLHRSPTSLRDHTPTMMSLSNFLSDEEMHNRPINYSNPFSVAGHIAGGIGSSDAGPDYRKIAQANVWLERVPLIGSTGYVKVSMSPRYEVFDTIDFCDGDCGSPAEQLVTVPMSRLEASGHAYDVPFKVIFRVPEMTERFWF